MVARRAMKECHRAAAVLAAALLAFSVGCTRAPVPSTVRDPHFITGPYASLLAASDDLGDSHADDVQLTVTLPHPARPDSLLAWAHNRGLSVRWRPDDNWAIVAGPAGAVAAAFEVPVHDYRGRQGQLFYASERQPAVPAALRGAVEDAGRILGYSPHHFARPPMFPLDVPQRGLSPAALLTSHNADSLAAEGFTGKGETIAFFEFDGYEQSDLDMYAETSGLPKFTPVLVGGQPGPSHGEAVMDLQVAHAIAPDARLVVVNARPTIEGDGAYEKIGQLFESVDRDFPGAVWSLSIGWGCEAILKAADLAPVRSALARALANGTTAFDASGDTGGLECKGGQDWSSPPGPDDIGLDAVAAVPEMTAVGGTTLSTDAQGHWLAEQAWTDGPLQQGSSGGVSRLFDRPAYQNKLAVERDWSHRLVPDVAAVADPFTGVRIVYEGQSRVGGGTSQSAPIWAAFTAVMNQYLVAHGGRRLGDLNPLLYRVAARSDTTGFRDISLGSNAVDQSEPGYDMVTGLGSPNIANLARALLAAQTGADRR